MAVDIWGIGHCCQDNICVVEQYPPEDGSTHILEIDDSQGGGAAATAMVAASRLGARAGVIANLGDDPVGDRILEGFLREGVQTELIRRISGGRSSTSYVMVNPENGSRTKFPYRDQLPALRFSDEIRAALAGARILHLDGTQYENALKAARLAKDCADGKVDTDQIDESLFSSYLDTAGMPDPDLLIRTSGELRLSNYLLWQLAYTEIVVTDCLWPDFNQEELEKAIVQYNKRDRRFGGVK